VGLDPIRLQQSPEDIKDLFCASCDAIGVRWTRSGREVAVARRESVALLDEFIGPKR
jgi:hypothetical protein